jgi:polar amino acid transport system substrate-binding protein
VDALTAWWEANALTRLFFSFEVMRDAFPVILKAFPVSILFGAGSFIFSIPGGLALAFMKMARSRWLRWPATLYVDVVRGTPLFLQILIVYFGLTLLPVYGDFVRANPWAKQPFLFGLDFTYYLRGFFVLSLNSAAYTAEIFRAGIQSIPRGQTEAARSLGMTLPQSMAFVIIPQTIRRILPTLMSEFILLFKDTALLSGVGMAEMTLRAREFAASTYNQSSYVVAAAFYLLVTIPLGRFVGRLEDRLAESEGGSGGKRAPLTAGNIDSEHVVAHSNPIPTSELRGGQR